MRYRFEAYDAHGNRLGGFTVVAESIRQALVAGSHSVELIDRFELRVYKIMDEAEAKEAPNT